MSPGLRVALSPFAPDSSTRWTDLKVVDDAVLIVQATINARPVSAIVDTGASISVIDPAFAPVAGRNETVQLGADWGRREVPVGGPVSIGLAGETLTVSTPVVASLAGLAQTGAGQVGLIIGQDALAQRVMLLQFSANRLAMKRTFEAPRGWGRLPLTVGNQGRLCIPAAIGAARASAVFDLGSANAVMASAAFIRSHGIADGLRTSTELIGALTGEQVAETFTAPSVTIGSYTMRGAPVDAFARWSDEQAPLNVGLPLILRFDLAVDIAERVLWLSPNAAFHSVFAKNRAGLGVAYEGDRLRVVHVSAGSPAARAGWRSEDFITRVNGRWVDAGYYSSGLSRWRNGPAGAVVRLQGDFRGIRSLRLEDLF